MGPAGLGAAPARAPSAAPPQAPVAPAARVPPVVGRRRPWRARLRDPAVAWLFLAPALLVFTLFKFIPMVRAVQMSLYEVRPFLGDRWVGWRTTTGW